MRRFSEREGVRLATRPHQALERIANFVRGIKPVVEPSRLEEVLIPELNAFPSVA